MALPIQRRRTSATLAATMCALLFFAGSFAVGSADVRPDDVFVPTATDMGRVPPTPEDRPAAEHQEPAPFRETDGHSLYGAFWEENLGQWPDEALWMLRGGPRAWLTVDGLQIHQEGGPITLSFVDGRASVPEAVEQRRSTTSIFGAETIEGARHADRLRMADVWPGIDFDVYVTDAGGLQYDFRVHPGADPSEARLLVGGADHPSIQDGRLVLDGISFEAPYTFQDSGAVASHFVLDGRTVSVAVGDYDPSGLLVIDPKLTYGTLVAPQVSSTAHRVYAAKETADGIYFGGTLYEPYYYDPHPLVSQTFDQQNGYYTAFFVQLDPSDNSLLAFVELRNMYRYGYTFGYDLEVDAEGRVWLVGQTGYYSSGTNTGIPVVGGLPSKNYYFDGFIARFAPAGGTAYKLQYSTHVGGTYLYSYYDGVWSIILNDDGTFWIGGSAAGNGVFPQAVKEVKHPQTQTYYANIFAMLFKDAPAPSPLMSTMFGGNYYYFQGIANMDTDENGDLYFAGSTYKYKYYFYGQFPTTPGALMPDPAGTATYENDHFYGKFSRDGTLEHLSYWGTPGYDGGYNSVGSKYSPDIAVVGVDEIVLAGTAGTCCVPLSAERLTPDRYGSYDGYLSRIHLKDGLQFSTHVGGKGADYVYSLAYDDGRDIYYVGGTARQPVQPEKAFSEEMPRPDHNGRYDAFVTAIEPALYDPAVPADQQEGMVAYTMYVGNAVGNFGTLSNVVWDLDISAQRSLLVGGTQGGSWDVEDASPVTKDAIDNGKGSGYYYTGFFQKYKLMNGLDIRATDGTNTGQTPKDGTFDTLTLTNVQLTATINETYLPWASLEDLVWDLDDDGTFDEGVGDGIHVVRRDHETKLPVCAMAIPVEAGPRPVKTCMDIFFENRPPIISLNLMHEPEGFLDPLPFYRVGQPVWYDAGFTNDPEGDLDFTKLRWVAEVRDGNGTWVPDPSVSIGGDASLGAKAVYDEPGQKRMSLFVEDILGAKAQAAIAVMILADPPVVECAFGGPVRMDRWIDVDVVTTTTASPIKNWTLDPGMGLPAMHGQGVPPFRIRTPNDLPAVGDGTMALTVRDEAGSATTCALDYVAGPRQVTADFGWDKAIAGEPVHFIDRSFPDTPERPVLSWQWHIDGIATSTFPDTTHVFGHAGTYMVSLTVSDGFRTDTYRVPIEVLPVPPGPTARIGIESPPYVAGEPIRFTDESLPGAAPITSWSWEYGRGSDDRRDVSVALPAGEHVVSLVVEDAHGAKGFDDVTVHVTGDGVVVPEFTVSSIEPTVGDVVVFTDVSRSGGAFVEDREWSFADGSRLAHGTTVQHTFWQPGTYDVTLTLYEARGDRYPVSHTITVVPPGDGDAEGPAQTTPQTPLADAGVDRRVQAGSVVLLQPVGSLVRQSAGATATWRQVGGPPVEVVPNGMNASLRVPYAVGEVLTLELMVQDANGLSEADRVRLHIVSLHSDGIGDVAPPDADFTVERTDRTVRLATPLHPVGAEYAWDLGDGTTATGHEVVHEYMAHGSYPVRLVVRDVHAQESVHEEHVDVRYSGDIVAPHQESAGLAKTYLGASLEAALWASLVLAGALALCIAIIARRR